MSVVNKMLQDLEARQSESNEVTADYQAPQKRQPKYLVFILLFVAILAITYALTDLPSLFEDKSSIKIEPDSTTPQKMAVVAQEVEQPKPTTTSLTLNTTDTAKHTDLAQNISKQTETTIAANTTTTAEPATATVFENTEQQNKEATDVVMTQKNAEASFTMSGSTSENTSLSLKQRIAESLNENNTEQAQKLLNQLLSKQPDNLQARKKLASLYFAQGKFVQTRVLLQQGMDIHPDQTDIRLMLARLHSAQKDPAQALNVLENYQPNTANQNEFIAYRASLAQQLNKTQDAKNDYVSLTAIDSENAKWWLGLAIAEDKLGNTNNALQAYQKANSLRQLQGSVNDFVIQRISVLAGAQ